MHDDIIGKLVLYKVFLYLKENPESYVVHKYVNNNSYIYLYHNDVIIYIPYKYFEYMRKFIKTYDIPNECEVRLQLKKGSMNENYEA